MSYATIEKQLRRLPENCLEEVSRYVEYLIYKQESMTRKDHDLERYFGSITTLPDGLELQRSVRDEQS